MNTFRKGFTVVEVMIVVVIIGLLAAMAIPAYQQIKSKNERSRSVTTLSDLPNNSDRFIYERQPNLSLAGMGIKWVILVTDKTTGKQFLMIEDFGTADLAVLKIESAPSSRYGR